MPFRLGGGGIKNKPEIRIKLEADESQLGYANHVESFTLMRPSPTKVGDASPTAPKRAVRASSYPNKHPK